MSHGIFKDGTHRVQYRVYYEDTDAAGVVYYANYLKFAERARTEALRACGFSQSELLKEHFGFVVRKCTIDYRAPAKLDDLLTIETSLHDIAKASLHMQQIIRKDRATLAECQVKLACIGAQFKPVRLPEKIAGAMRKKFEFFN